MFDIGFPISPMNCLMGGSCFHSSNVISCICNVEVMRVMMALVTWKTVQDVCKGRVNKELKSHFRWLSVGQCHCGTEPNDQDKMSARTFHFPAMCWTTSRDTWLKWRRKVMARSRCPAGSDVLNAMRSVQLTVGKLSLKRPTCQFLRDRHVRSMITVVINWAVILRSDMLMDLVRFVDDTSCVVIAGGHCPRKTVGDIG